MNLRLPTALLAAFLLLHPMGAARAQDDQGQFAPVQDPLGIFRPPAVPEQEEQTTAPAPAPKKAELPPVKDILRNEKPMGGVTEIFERKDFVVDNGKDPKHTLTYFWKTPKDLGPTPKELYPLVIILHNAEGKAPAGEILTTHDNRRDFPAYIAVPVLPAGQVWAFPDSFPDEPGLSYMGGEKQRLPDIVNMLPQLLKDNPIDAHRIYVVGCAEGGFGAYGAAMKYPNIFAAAIPINGAWAIGDSKALTKVPLFVLHGEKDATFPPRLSRDVAYFVQRYGGNIHYIQVPLLGHDCADPRLYTRTMWDWLFQQKKRGRVLQPAPD